MRSQSMVIAGAALTVTLAIGGAAAFVGFVAARNGTPAVEAKSSNAAAAESTTETASPQPTVTVTKKIRKTVAPAPAPAPRYYYGADAAFLSAIAGDGIVAPSDWAVEAGRETCGASYSYAYGYLTDGGIYGYHVQTFLDDWASAHGGC
ncbi:hypothetical protein GCM10009727_49170 [Actinomadura napierensis]|uniref:Secreted protein n=2 Tax=Actinomadura napierensis TaxID=267854 RepID=A0ABN2ZTD7_9ACTN